jgi:hypothetical protein
MDEKQTNTGSGQIGNEGISVDTSRTPTTEARLVIKYAEGQIIASDGSVNRVVIDENGIIIKDASGNNVIAANGDVRGLNVKNISADDITAGTLTGRTVQTSSSGQRVVLDGTNNYISLFDASRERMRLSQATLSFWDASGNVAGTIVGSYYAPWTSAIIQLNAFTRVEDDMAIAGPLTCESDLSVLGSKDFNIPHPTKKDKRLVYSAIESPEVLLVCRGIIDRETDEIELPQHFVDITEENTIHIQIGKLYKSERYSWIATGVRKGYLDRNCEPDVKDLNLQRQIRRQHSEANDFHLKQNQDEAQEKEPIKMSTELKDK